MSLDWLDQAAQQTTCDILSAAGYGLVGTAVPTLVAGGTGVVPLTLGSLSLLASNALCPNTNVGGTLPPEGLTGCTGVTGGVGKLLKGSKTNMQVVTDPHSCQNQIVGIVGREIGQGAQSGEWYARATYVCADGRVRQSQLFYASPNTEEAAKNIYFGLEPIPPATCDRTADEPIQPMPPEVYTPRNYTDPDTSCNYTITFQSFVQSTPDGPATPVFKVEAAGDQLRNDGGVIGGCNFAPTLYYSGPVGPGGGGPGGGGPGGPTTIPWQPDWDAPVPPGGIPPWVAPLITLLSSSGGFADYEIPAGTREIYAACEYKQNGNPETYSVNYPTEKWSERVLTALDGVVDFQQQILLWRTPTCATSSPKVGDYRTISFISDEKSPNGDGRLAKRFRYRSSSGVGLDGVVDHWRDFTWSAGPVCVQHRDTQLGAPQVWASSIDEGKRVIRHAATEAGIDPDTTGRWEVSGSDNPRYGMPGTMRVNTSGGYYWITSRLGPDQRPPVALT